MNHQISMTPENAGQHAPFGNPLVICAVLLLRRYIQHVPMRYQYFILETAQVVPSQCIWCQDPLGILKQQYIFLASWSWRHACKHILNMHLLQAQCVQHMVCMLAVYILKCQYFFSRSDALHIAGITYIYIKRDHAKELIFKYTFAHAHCIAIVQPIHLGHAREGKMYRAFGHTSFNGAHEHEGSQHNSFFEPFSVQIESLMYLAPPYIL